MNFLRKEIDNEKKEASKVPPSNLFQVSHIFVVVVVVERQSVKEK